MNTSGFWTDCKRNIANRNKRWYLFKNCYPKIRQFFTTEFNKLEDDDVQHSNCYPNKQTLKRRYAILLFQHRCSIL